MSVQSVGGCYSAEVDLSFSQAARLGVPSDTAARATEPLTIVHVSDTHSVDYTNVPPGDILVHSGDFTNRGKPEETEKFVRWLHAQPHPFKIVVCGNHEVGYDAQPFDEIIRVIGQGAPNVFVLHDTAVDVKGIRFYGSSWNNCGGGYAWGATPEQRAAHWQSIPADVDVLITHQPALGIFDLAWVKHGGQGTCGYCRKLHDNFEHWGDGALRQRIETLRIPAHLCGHVHDDVGVRHIGDTLFSNAAMDIKKKVVMIRATVLDTMAATAAPMMFDPRRTVPASAAFVSNVPPALLPHVKNCAPQPSDFIASSRLGAPFRVLVFRHDPTAASLSGAIIPTGKVLDLDAADHRSLILWKAISPIPKNQLFSASYPIASAAGGARAPQLHAITAWEGADLAIACDRRDGAVVCSPEGPHAAAVHFEFQLPFPGVPLVDWIASIGGERHRVAWDATSGALTFVRADDPRSRVLLFGIEFISSNHFYSTTT